MVAAMLVGPAMLVSPATAQLATGKQKTPLDLKYEREEQEQHQNEQDYNRTMKRLKAQDAVKTSSDPWKNVRPSSSGSSR
jgi:hypothetical protein